jgi:uncharacterized protein with PIN domain
MSKVFVLDACALVALLNNENGAEKSGRRIQNGRNRQCPDNY